MQETTSTHRWREFSDDGDYEPDDTLRNRNTSVSRENGSGQYGELLRCLT